MLGDALGESNARKEEAVRQEVAQRLGRVCANFSAEEFRDLVDKVTEQRLRAERKPVW
jgi:hypothetical protein